MSDASASPAVYSRWPRSERGRHGHPLQEAMTELRRLLPMGRSRFDSRLAAAVAEALRCGSGFRVGGFAARRALGSALLIDIDPSLLEHQLDHRIQHEGRAYSIRDRFVGAGDWTPLLQRLKRSSTHRECVEVVVSGFDYHETQSYRKALARAASSKPIRRNFIALDSPAKVEVYFRQTADMCRSIQDVGLVRRSDYGRRLSSFAPSVRLPWIEFGEVDIGVAIGPDGEVYRFASGKHRTAAAQALKLPSIPVEIRLVHAAWLARHMAEAGLGPLAALRRGIEELKLACR